MCYLNLDKNQMTNLQSAPNKEILLTNRAGAYCSTSVIGCNIRKYHGLLVLPVPNLDDESHVLLSSLDETVIQHGAEFNLGVHKYQGDNFSPKGHKYIIQFEWEKVPTVYYRVGGVILKKEIIFRQNETRLLVRYTLEDAHSATTLRLRPFLAFRSVREFTHKNTLYNGFYEDIENGIKTSMYSGYPELFMQTSKKNSFSFQPNWYMGLDYPRERERGYSSNEDLYQPGYFEIPIKKGESIIFSAGISEIKTNTLKHVVEKEIEMTDDMSSFYNCLVYSAHQFHQEKNGEHYIVAGYPWFKCRARDFFLSLSGLTLSLGDVKGYEMFMETAGKALESFIAHQPIQQEIHEFDQPDVLLCAALCLQRYSESVGMENFNKKYGKLMKLILDYIINGEHPNLFLHKNGLLYTNGHEKPVTWMNSVVDGHPIIPRSGYIVEFNALWYNTLRFWAEVQDTCGKKAEAQFYSELADKVKVSFHDVFLNQYGYLYDYVDGNVPNKDVRPNMIMAVALQYSPLERMEQKSVLDVCTKELLTSKGLRSLTPKSGAYNPIYKGSRYERDLAYHQGTAWPWLTGYYLEAYQHVYQKSGLSFIERQLIGFEEELFYHSLGSIPEFFDGNPPFHGRGAISFAMNVAGILRAIRLLDKSKQE